MRLVRYGMTIDLNRCVGCNSCTVACKVENGTTSGVFWRRVLIKEVGKFPTARRIFLPIQCNHCEEPLCVYACPTGASYQRDDGIVLVDYEKCIGCHACTIACPYQVRFFIEDTDSIYPNGPTPYEENLYKSKKYPKFQRGTNSKCTFCVDRVEAGRDPACVESCPAEAMKFGDTDDPRSEISHHISLRKGFQLLPERGTDPRVYYLW